jgi:NitT/TauT family transport system permease protein
MKRVLNLFTPNKTIPKKDIVFMIAGQIVMLVFLWHYLSTPLLPKPMEILSAWKDLVVSGGLLNEMYISTKLCFHALFISIITCAILAYSTVLPFFKPAGFMMRMMRFLPMIGLSFVFTLMTSSGYSLKVSLLVFGMSVFILESMLAVVHSVTDVEYNHARTIHGGNEWKVVWERVIRGKAHEMLFAVKQNFAISWTMLTFAEGLVRADGGVGTMLLNENKHFQLASLFAVQFSLFILGIGIDYLFGVLRNFLFPYADLLNTSKR